jgi:hypothetical protein
MADISASVDPIAAAIFEQYEKSAEAEKARTYLGASVIGGPCSRRLWYAFRWARKEQFEGRVLRVFQTGHLAEPRFVADLRSIGAKVHDVDPASGKQFGFSDHGGHAKGHMDGCAVGVPGGGNRYHVLEFKTHSAKSFADLRKKGVKASKPEHFAQMQWYMGQSGMDRALYLAVNKDDDDLHSERIEFDQVEYERIQVKFNRIIFAVEPPPKISDDPKYYLCGWCPFNGVCHGHQTPDVSCRTCVHATPEADGDGRWSCDKHPDGRASEITIQIQRVGCSSMLPLPFLLTYAVAVDGDESRIAFVRRDTGDPFAVVTEDRRKQDGHVKYHYTPREIAAAKDYRAIANEDVESLRGAFEGRIAG